MEEHHNTSWLGLVIMAAVFLFAFGGLPILADLIPDVKAWDKSAKAILLVLVVFGGLTLDKLYQQHFKRG